MDSFICSVIIPVYNVEETLVRCIESVLKAKKNYNIEIVLVNDGSKDNSLSICLEYKSKYDFIKVIDQENKGLPGARNSGLKIAEGRYIAFLDSDDTITEDYFDVLIPYTESSYNMVQFGYKRKEIDREINFKPLNEIVNRKGIIAKIPNSTQNKILWFVWRRIYNLKFLKKFDINFNENIKYGEDTDFSLKVLKYIHEYKSVDKVLYNYFENKDSLTGQKFKNDLLSKYEIQYIERKKYLFPDISKQSQLEDIAKNYINNALLALFVNLKNSPNSTNHKQELKNIRKSIVYQETFDYYEYDWKHLKRSVMVKLFELKYFRILNKLIQV